MNFRLRGQRGGRPYRGVELRPPIIHRIGLLPRLAFEPPRLRLEPQYRGVMPRPHLNRFNPLQRPRLQQPVPPSSTVMLPLIIDCPVCRATLRLSVQNSQLFLGVYSFSENNISVNLQICPLCYGSPPGDMLDHFEEMHQRYGAPMGVYSLTRSKRLKYYGPDQYTAGSLILSTQQPPNQVELRSNVIQELRDKVKKLQEVQREEANRNVCQVCSERLDKPCVSVKCWHVFCKRCWLYIIRFGHNCRRCHQNSDITDLRVIYL